MFIMLPDNLASSMSPFCSELCAGRSYSFISPHLFIHTHEEQEIKVPFITVDFHVGVWNDILTCVCLNGVKGYGSREKSSIFSNRYNIRSSFILPMCPPPFSVWRRVKNREKEKTHRLSSHWFNASSLTVPLNVSKRRKTLDTNWKSQP